MASLGRVAGGVLSGRLARRIAFAGSWAAGWWVFFSPLRRQRDIPSS